MLRPWKLYVLFSPWLVQMSSLTTTTTLGIELNLRVNLLHPNLLPIRGYLGTEIN